MMRQKIEKAIFIILGTMAILTGVACVQVSWPKTEETEVATENEPVVVKDEPLTTGVAITNAGRGNATRETGVVLAKTEATAETTTEKESEPSQATETVENEAITEVAEIAENEEITEVEQLLDEENDNLERRQFYEKLLSDTRRLYGALREGELKNSLGEYLEEIQNLVATLEAENLGRGSAYCTSEKCLDLERRVAEYWVRYEEFGRILDEYYTRYLLPVLNDANATEEEKRIAREIDEDHEAYMADVKDKIAGLEEKLNAEKKAEYIASFENGTVLFDASLNSYPFANSCPGLNWRYTGRYGGEYGGLYCECTSYAGYKATVRWGVSINWGDAKYWGSGAVGEGHTVDNNPTVGSIGFYTSGTWGHVVWVEGVNSDGTINYSEYNGQRVADFSYVKGANASEFQYIHFDY